MKLEDMLLIGVCGALGFGIAWSMVGKREDKSAAPPQGSEFDHDPARERRGDAFDDT